jgi:hypothetical protein
MDENQPIDETAARQAWEGVMAEINMHLDKQSENATLPEKPGLYQPKDSIPLNNDTVPDATKTLLPDISLLNFLPGANYQPPDMRFISTGSEDLELLAEHNSQSPYYYDTAKGAYKELIRRADMRVNPGFVEDFIQTSSTMLDSMERKHATAPDYNKNQAQKPEVDEDKRYKFHRAITEDLKSITEPFRLRQKYAEFAKSTGQSDRDLSALDAVEQAELLSNRKMVDGKLISVFDIAAREANLLKEDMKQFPEIIKSETLTQANNYLADPETGMLSAIRKTLSRRSN